MIIHLKDGSMIGLDIAADLFYDIYQFAKRGLIEVRITTLRTGEAKYASIVECVDADLTFQKIIEKNFPSLPPDIPAGPDTESAPGLLGGDDADWERSQSGYPVSSTMPSRKE